MATLRLTRRGRIALVVTVMMMAVIGGMVVGHGSSLAAGRADRAVHPSVVVKPGESLWAVAARVAPDQDPRLVVADIESLNRLGGPAVQPGQQLLVPATG
jgi:hypothetical protein